VRPVKFHPGGGRRDGLPDDIDTGDSGQQTTTRLEYLVRRYWGVRPSPDSEGMSAPPDLGDFPEFDRSSHPAAFPSDEREFDVIKLALQVNADQATASRSSISGDISPAQKRKRAELKQGYQ
jgi:hypothetical protein